MTPVPLGGRVVLDTNVFIGAFRSAEWKARVTQLRGRVGPREFLSSVVAQELRTGARTRSERQQLEAHVLSRYARTRRVMVPSDVAWQRSGDVLSELRIRDGFDLTRVSKAFGNDVLIAMSCREWGATLVTDNVRDFARIAAIVPFDYVSL